MSFQEFGNNGKMTNLQIYPNLNQNQSLPNLV